MIKAIGIPGNAELRTDPEVVATAERLRSALDAPPFDQTEPPALTEPTEHLAG